MCSPRGLESDPPTQRTDPHTRPELGGTVLQKRQNCHGFQRHSRSSSAAHQQLDRRVDNRCDPTFPVAPRRRAPHNPGTLPGIDRIPGKRLMAAARVFEREFDASCDNL